MSNLEATIKGKLGADPEMSYTSTGKALTKAGVAVSLNKEVPNKETGKKEWVNSTLWFNITAWEGIAQALSKLSKGDKVTLKGYGTFTKTSAKGSVGVDFTVTEIVPEESGTKGSNSRQKSQVGPVMPDDWSEEAHQKAIKMEGDHIHALTYYSTRGDCVQFYQEETQSWDPIPF